MRLSSIFIIILSLVYSPLLFSQNNSLSFDGVDDYVEVSTGVGIDNLTNVTVEAFINPNSTTSTPFLVCRFDATLNENFKLGLLSDGRVDFRINDNPITSTIPVSTGQYTHIAVTYDGNTRSIYINGVLDNFSNLIGSINNTVGGKLLFGADSDNNGLNQFYDGYIDEVRIWNYARSQPEISNNIFTELTGTEPGLVGYYKLDDPNSPDDVVDCSPNLNHGVRIGQGGGNNLPQYSGLIPTGMVDVPCGGSAIPTLSEWSLIILSILMLITAIVSFLQTRIRSLQ